MAPPSSNSPITISADPATQPANPAQPNPPTTDPQLPPRQAGIFDALRTIRPSDFTTFYQKPCARESLLTGIGAGFAIGGLRFVVLARGAPQIPSKPNTSTISATKPGPQIPSSTSASTGAASTSPSAARKPRLAPNRSIANNSLSARAWRSMTWAVFAFTAFSAGSHIFCQRRRALEQAAMARAAEIVARKRAEKQAELVARRKAERERRRLEHEEGKMGRSRWGVEWLWRSGGGGGGERGGGDGRSGSAG